MITKSVVVCSMVLGIALASLCIAQLYPPAASDGLGNDNGTIAGCSPNEPPSFGIYHGGELIISDKDIESYNWTSHAIRLTPGGVAKIKSHAACDNVLEPPYGDEIMNVDWCQPGSGLYGEEFVAKVGDIELYRGVFSSTISSYAYTNEVVMYDVLMVSEENPVMWLEFGCSDPRETPILGDYLAETGKLVI